MKSWLVIIHSLALLIDHSSAPVYRTAFERNRLYWSTQWGQTLICWRTAD